MDTKTLDLNSMSIHALARVIDRDWKNVNYAARPYLEAMYELHSVDNYYGLDSGKDIVRYFLSNATSWRGDTARAVKAELKSRL